MQAGQTAAKIQGQMARFSGKLSAGLPKVARRFVREAVYGIQSRGSVKLSEIARALEEPTQMKKRIERLGRQLGRSGLRSAVRDNLLRMGARKVSKETLLVADITDISKPEAEKMEYLARVRDGSTGEITSGYWSMEVVAARRDSAKVVPLYQELYSQESPDFESENQEILRAVDHVNGATGKTGTWVVDRGGDRGEIIRPLLAQRLAFLIRMRGDRHLIWGRSKESVEEIAARVRPKWRETIVRETSGKEKVYELAFGATPVRFPGFEQKLSLVVVWGFGKRPLMLLTTLPTGRSKKRIWRVVESYLARWRVEETIRFIKQSYELEDIRVLTYERLKSMVTLVAAVAYFCCVHLGQRTKLRIMAEHVWQASKRIYGTAEFRFYGIASGIKEVLFGRSRAFGPGPASPEERNTLLLPLGP